MHPLQEQFNKEIRPELMKEFGFTNLMQVPTIKKIVINVGIGKLKKDAKLLESMVGDLKAITGQHPVFTTARKSIAGFKVREGEKVGLTATLRGFKMWSFLDKLINVALPRVRDFRGLSSEALDGRGSYSMGLREQLVFPEISSDALEHTFGIEITIVTNSGQDKPTKKMLQLMRFPFKD